MVVFVCLCAVCVLFSGNVGKVSRAKDWGHWFLADSNTSCVANEHVTRVARGDVPVPSWIATKLLPPYSKVMAACRFPTNFVNPLR